MCSQVNVQFVREHAHMPPHLRRFIWPAPSGSMRTPPSGSASREGLEAMKLDQLQGPCQGLKSASLDMQMMKP